MNGPHRCLRWYLAHAPVQSGKGALTRVAFRFLGPAEIVTAFGMRMQADPRDVPLQRALFISGVYEPATTHAFREILRPGDVFVDVGANIGYHSLLAATLVGAQGRVLAFEPSTLNREVLERHIALNGVRNVRVFPIGLGDRSESQMLHFGPEGNVGAASLRSVEDSAGEEVVELRRGDQAVPSELWPRIRLVKIDVEGAELAVLRGLSRMLESLPPPFIIAEVTNRFLKQLGDGADELLAFLDRYGYAAHPLAEHPLRNGDPQADTLFRHGQRVGQLASPAKNGTVTPW